jgi:DNA-binding NarL/FixJ family response regulator
LIEEFAKRPQPSGKRPKELDSLTERELEVLREIAKGLTNGEIAKELHVSETTIKTHVAHLLDKLDLRDRVQAVILAYEAGLIERS